jgi:ABC-2 type transport system permease protein
MLWYKAWLDTRGRFLIGLVLLVLSAAGVVAGFPHVQRIGAVQLDPNEPFQQQLSDAIELSRTFRGFVWHEWFRQNALSIGALFAALLGTSHIFSSSRRGLLFTLSLPASRRHWFATRAATGLAELLVLMVVPSLVIPLLGAAMGQPYGVGEALVYALCGFVGVATFFGLALLLSTIFHDAWRPILIVCLVAVCVSLFELLVPNNFGVFSVLSAENYLRGGSLPWAGLSVFVVVTAALLYAAARKIERHDF